MFKNLSMTALGLTARESERIELALTYGFRGLELDTAELMERVERFDLNHARRLIDSAKVKIGSFDLPFAIGSDDATYQKGIAALSKVAEVLGELGARRCLTAIAPASDDSPYHENFERHRARFAEVGGLLAKHDVTLGVGFSAMSAERQDRAFEFVHDAGALAVLLSTTTSANVGAVVDTWHLHASGGSLAQLEKLGAERIVAVYVSDAPADVAPADLVAAQRLLPGEGGAIDTPALLVRLAEIGYSGPITPSASRDGLEGLNRDGAVRKAAETLDTAWKAAGLSPSGKLLSTANTPSA